MSIPSTPVSRSKSAALARVIDSIPRGYTRYTTGSISADRVQHLVRKLHRIHAIAAPASTKASRKARGQANAVLSIYCPPDATKADWLMLFTAGELNANEKLCDVDERPRLSWLGYELSRHTSAGPARWTWRRPSDEMRDLHALLDEHLKRRTMNSVQELLERAARQPGFHGVREQTWRLCEEARRHGYQRELPPLYYLQKINHGERISAL